ncbi:MAG: hypothetical protein AB1807_25520 [Pseudomonadota bacterium]
MTFTMGTQRENPADAPLSCAHVLRRDGRAPHSRRAPAVNVPLSGK